MNKYNFCSFIIKIFFILQLLFFAYINRNYVKTVHNENYTLNYSDYVGEVVKKAEKLDQVGYKEYR